MESCGWENQRLVEECRGKTWSTGDLLVEDPQMSGTEWNVMVEIETTTACIILSLAMTMKLE
jgi:hypothetical protein